MTNGPAIAFVAIGLVASASAARADEAAAPPSAHDPRPPQSGSPKYASALGYSDPHVVPNAYAYGRPPVQYRRRSRAMMGVGFGFMALAEVLVVLSQLSLAIDSTCREPGSLTAHVCGSRSFAPVFELIAAPLVALGIGAPLLVSGAERVPVRGTGQNGSAVAGWVGEPGGGGWKWRF